MSQILKLPCRTTKPKPGRSVIKPKIKKLVRNSKPNTPGLANSAESETAPVAFIGNGVTCQGVLTTDGQMQIDGKLEGEIHTKGTVVVGAKGVVSAQIEAESVVSQGKISGSVTAAKHIHLQSTAVVKGAVQTPYLVMDEGAVLETDWSIWINGAWVSSRTWEERYPMGGIQYPEWWKPREERNQDAKERQETFKSPTGMGKTEKNGFYGVKIAKDLSQGK